VFLVWILHRWHLRSLGMLAVFWSFLATVNTDLYDRHSINTREAYWDNNSDVAIVAPF